MFSPKRFFIQLMAMLLMSWSCFADGNAMDILAKRTLVNAKGKKTTADVALAEKSYIGIYFSAHWCPPCRSFTPLLVKFRDDMVKQGKNFEVVFISFDKNETAMQGYMKDAKMQWLAVPFDSPRKNKIANKYGVGGIPTLIILAPDGSTITSGGRADVTKQPGNAFKIWEEKAKK